MVQVGVRLVVGHPEAVVAQVAGPVCVEVGLVRVEVGGAVVAEGDGLDHLAVGLVPLEQDTLGDRLTNLWNLDLDYHPIALRPRCAPPPHGGAPDAGRTREARRSPHE